MNVYVKTAETCNFRCKHCFNPYSSIPMNFEKTWKFLSQLDKEGNWFILHGGEPMMGDEEKILSLVKSTKHASWRISTNLGYKLTPKKLEILQLMKQVRTSFDVGIRFGNMRNLMMWLRNVQALSKKTDLYMNICLTRQMISHSPENVIRMLESLGVKRYGFERITLSGRAKEHTKIVPRYEDVDDWLCKLYAIEESGRCACHCDDIQRIRLGIQGHEEQCYGKECCMQTITINADGTVGNCPNNARENIVGTAEDKASMIKDRICKKKHTVKSACLACSFFRACHGFCEQIEWQNGTCPYPKKLARKIMEEEH